MEDVFGRKLGDPYSGAITFPGEPPPAGEARFLDYGHVMLESQFPPRLLFEYKNIADSRYLLATTNNPWSEVPANAVVKNLSAGEANHKYF